MSLGWVDPAASPQEQHPLHLLAVPVPASSSSSSSPYMFLLCSTGNGLRWDSYLLVLRLSQGSLSDHVLSSVPPGNKNWTTCFMRSGISGH